MKILSYLLVFLTILQPVLFAAPRNVDEQYKVNQNLVVNPGFENGTHYWSASGGTLTADSATVGQGNFSGKWISSAGSQTLKSKTTVTIPLSLFGKNGLARIRYKTTATDFVFSVYMNGVQVATETLAASTGNGFADAPDLTWVFNGSADAIYMQLTSGSAQTIYVDDAYIGEYFRIGQVAQSQQIGTAFWPTTASCAWQNTSGTWSNIGANASCVNPTVTGFLVAAGTKIPGVSMNNVSPGTYRVILQGLFGQYSNSTCSFRLSDGTSTPGFARSGGENYNDLVGDFTYTTTQSSVTWQVQSKLESGAGGCQVLDSSESQVLWFYVVKLPSSSQTTVNPNTTAMSWSGTLTGTGGGWGGITTSSYGDFSVATTSTTLTQLTANNIGSVVAEATKLPAITYTPTKLGFWQICASGSGTNSTAQNNYFRLVDGAGTVINGGTSVTNAAAGGNSNFSLCGIYQITSLSAVTFKIQGASTGATLSLVQSATAPITWSILDVSQNFPAPVIQNQVSTSTSGGARVEWVKSNGICTTNPCALSRSSAGISQVSASGTGTYDVIFVPGTFSSTPSCTYTTEANGVAPTSPAGIDSGTHSATDYHFAGINSTNGAALNFAFDMICVGPK